MSIILALFIFSLIIIIHELGHFLLAKYNGVTVLEFSLGMGPRILSTVKGGTRYSWKLLPFGGSCAMLGEDEATTEEGSFGSKSVWARISVIAAGPIFNFILAFLLSLFIIGSIGYDAPVISYVGEGTPAAEAGIQVGDRILKMNNQRIHVAREITGYTLYHPNEETITVTWEHEGEKKTADITLQMDEEVGRKLMGISVSGARTKLGPVGVLKYSAYEVKYWIATTLDGLKLLISLGLNDMSGPVGVVNMIGSTYNESKADGGFLCMAEHAEYFHSSDCQPGCHEPSASSGSGRRPPGFPFPGSHPPQTHRPGERRHGPYDRPYGSDGIDGCDYVQ